MEDTNEASGQSPETSSHSASLQAAKRLKYTAIACDECKRRKIKCDGQNPCHRCARHPTTCVYTQRGTNVVTQQEIEWKRMNEKISKLQEQVSLLVSTAMAGVPLGGQQHTPATPVSTSLHERTKSFPYSPGKENHSDSYVRRRSRAARQPQYTGPTSSAFSSEVGGNSLQGMGIQSGTDLIDNAIMGHSTTPARSPMPSNNLLHLRDPLISIGRSEAFRLVDLYEEESGTVYPFIDIKLVLNAAQKFFNGAVASRDASAVRESADENMLSGGVVDILKLVIAIALVFEGHGPTRLSLKLLDNVESGFQGRLCGPSVDILEIQAWTLMSILQFHCDEEARAWRTIGIAARAAVELGLHRRDTYFSRFSDSQQRLWANRLFWCIYVLDRQWSFGTGLPFALHDDDIDPELPEQSDSNSSLLKLMIAYGQLGSKVWKATFNLNASVDAETLDFLNFQVRQWQDSIPSELKMRPNSENMLDGHSRNRNRLRALLYLRANQMRLHIFRQALLSPKTITNDSPGAQQAVNIAKDTICVLDRLNRISDIYSSQQTAFNYFLVSALAAILLAVCHSTSPFNQNCREEFYLGLELVRGFSGDSHVAIRLWRTVRHLKVVGPKLGVFPTQEAPRDRPNVPQLGSSSHEFSTAAMGQCWSAGCAADTAFDSDVSPTYSIPLDGNQLSDELTTLFEAIEPTYEQLPAHNPENPRDFGFYSYGTTDCLSRSLLDFL